MLRSNYVMEGLQRRAASSASRLPVPGNTIKMPLWPLPLELSDATSLLSKTLPLNQCLNIEILSIGL